MFSHGARFDPHGGWAQIHDRIGERLNPLREHRENPLSVLRRTLHGSHGKGGGDELVAHLEPAYIQFIRAIEQNDVEKLHKIFTDMSESIEARVEVVPLGSEQVIQTREEIRDELSRESAQRTQKRTLSDLNQKQYELIQAAVEKDERLKKAAFRKDLLLDIDRVDAIYGVSVAQGVVLVAFEKYLEYRHQVIEALLERKEIMSAARDAYVEMIEADLEFIKEKREEYQDLQAWASFAENSVYVTHKDSDGQLVNTTLQIRHIPKEELIPKSGGKHYFEKDKDGVAKRMYFDSATQTMKFAKGDSQTEYVHVAPHGNKTFASVEDYIASSKAKPVIHHVIDVNEEDEKRMASAIKALQSPKGLPSKAKAGPSMLFQMKQSMSRNKEHNKLRSIKAYKPNRHTGVNLWKQDAHRGEQGDFVTVTWGKGGKDERLTFKKQEDGYVHYNTDGPIPTTVYRKDLNEIREQAKQMASFKPMKGKEEPSVKAESRQSEDDRPRPKP